MQFTWGFLLLFVVFIFPGLIIRRLYFFGEFSKQFGYNDPLLKTIAYALVPGLINVIITFFLYNTLIGSVDLGVILDVYKDMGRPDQKFEGRAMNAHFRNDALPFLALLYTMSFLIGFVCGRTIRLIGLDTRFKLFRFKNQWFYLFTGNHRRLRKYQPHFGDENRFLFLKADVLVDSGEGNKLYSGTVVDYELSPDNGTELSKVVLKDARRYSKDDAGKVQPKTIPGSMLVVDCSKLVNINLTHVYETEEARVSRDQARWNTIDNILMTLSLLLLPFLFFRIKWIDSSFYTMLLGLTWPAKIIYMSVIVQAFMCSI